MNSLITTLAVLVVVVVVLCQCGPVPNGQGTLAKRLNSIFKARQLDSVSEADKRSATEGGEGYRRPCGEKCEDFKWPWAMMEFSQFLGRCESMGMFFRLMDSNTTFTGMGVIHEGCPWAYNVADRVMAATDDQRKHAERLFESIIHVLQCGNLMAEAESLYFFNYVLQTKMAMPDLDDNVYMKEAKPLFDVCEKVFDGVDEEITRFEEGLSDVLNYFDNTQTRYNKENVRSLINEITRLLHRNTDKEDKDDLLMDARASGEAPEE